VYVSALQFVKLVFELGILVHQLLDLDVDVVAHDRVSTGVELYGIIFGHRHRLLLLLMYLRGMRGSVSVSGVGRGLD